MPNILPLTVRLVRTIAPVATVVVVDLIRQDRHRYLPQFAGVAVAFWLDIPEKAHFCVPNASSRR